MDLIQRAINDLQIDKSEYENVIMVGDRHFDIEGAKEAGIASIGVLYGYGSKEELSAAGADRIVNNVWELAEVYFKYSSFQICRSYSVYKINSQHAHEYRQDRHTPNVSHESL